MTIEEFWNKAFLAALHRLPVAQAKKEADAATQACVQHWQANALEWAPPTLRRWQTQHVSEVPLSREQRIIRQNEASASEKRKAPTSRSASKKT